jgi:minor extracellular serine protease Vpr
MRKLSTILALLAVLALVVPVAAQQGVQPIEPLVPPPSVETGEMIDETPDLWFVELSSQPAVEGTKVKVLKNEKAAFRRAAAMAGLTFTERFAFDTLWNGLSIRIEPGDLSELARIEGVKALYPVVPVSLPEPAPGAEPDLYTSLAMIGADVAQSELGYSGAGIKVAVVDSGIDYDHPDLGGCFGPGCRVAYGYDLVGDAFTGANDPVADDDPDDCLGHGTHVAGIIGANGGVVGVAPEVTFGAYRVFGCSGYTWADIMIVAMEMALADGMQVLNMSIGSDFQWPQYPTAVASDRLVNKGMVVVASIGNEAEYGVYSAGAPGVGKKVIGVASFDNTNTMLPYFEVAGQRIGYIGMDYAAAAPTSGTEEIVYVGRGCVTEDPTAVPPVPPGGDPYLADPSGKVALISRGACSFRDKALGAQAAGATAAVVHNNASGNFNGTLNPPYVDFPVVSISREDGMFIQGLAPVDMTWTDQLYSFPSPTAGLISDFSSYGLAPDLSLKPDIGAPGGDIYSTLPLEQGGYGTKGGTSMAAPHVAGAVALLLEAKPHTPSQVVRDILQNSADPQVWSLNPGPGFLDNVHRQGAGMLDIDDAILATTKITPGKIAVGESEAGPQSFKLTIENNGDMDVTYDLSYVSAVATTGTWAEDLGFWLTFEDVVFNKDSVTVPAGGTKNVQATIYPPTGPNLGTYGGYIVFTPQDGGQVFRVPYAGFVGDYQALPVLDANPFGLPWLLGGPTFTMQGGDVPEFWVNLGHQVRKLRMEVFDAVKGKNWHRVFDYDYVGRNDNYDYIYSFTFDGTTMNGKKVNVVPDGDYYAVISVLKALGDDGNPAHWETWTSPVFTIDRP